MTDRINVVKDSPSTRFVLEADRVSTSISGNYSIVRCYLRAHNGPSGTTGSSFLGSGAQAGRVNGVEFGRREASPFLPSGYARNAQRWRVGPWNVRVDHASNGVGSAALEMHLSYGSIAEVHSASLGLPTIPQTPTALSVSRVSDTQQSLSWTRTSTYTSVVVQRRSAAGSGWGSWQQIASISGNASSYSDRSTATGRQYQYRVAGRAAAGQSGWSNTATVFTTPGVTSGVSAQRSGDDIVVSVSSPAYALSFDVRDGSTTVATGVSLPWTHVSPNPAVPHTYSVRGRRGSLLGPWSSPSNTVQLLSPPNAPAGLSPNGTPIVTGEESALTWVHNPVDSSPQTAIELQANAGGAWFTLFTGTTETWYAFTPAGVGSIDWRVRTKGEHPDWSPWSATATVVVIDRPGVAVTVPEEVWEASVLPVEWSWLQNQSWPQSAWQVELVGDEGVVETREGSGDTSTVTLSTRLTEGEWTVRVRAATGDIWSVWAEQSFEVVFDPPAAPTLDAVWDDTQGTVTITVAPVDDPLFVDTVSVLVERSVDGETWETVAEVVEMSTLVDPESLSYGDTIYRATAFTAEGATAVTEVTVEARSPYHWLNGGVGFGEACRLLYNTTVQISGGRQRALRQYAGRSLPVALTGEAVSRTVAVSGVVTDRDGEVSTPDELLDLVQSESDVFILRDPDGRRIYGSVSAVDLPRESATSHESGWQGWWGYSFTLTETVREA